MSEQDVHQDTRDGGLSMLKRLEQLVVQASEEIVGLRASKQELETKVNSLEKKVGSLEKERDEGQGVLSQWTEQQEQIETRLESLASGLEGLLAE